MEDFKRQRRTGMIMIGTAARPLRGLGVPGMALSLKPDKVLPNKSTIEQQSAD